MFSVEKRKDRPKIPLVRLRTISAAEKPRHHGALCPQAVRCQAYDLRLVRHVKEARSRPQEFCLAWLRLQSDLDFAYRWEFNALSTFNRSFKQRYGMPPRQYRTRANY